MEHCPQVVVSESYITDKERIREEIASIIVSALVEIPEFKADVGRMLQRFPWLVERGLPGSGTMDEYNPFLPESLWPSDWREAVGAMWQLASKWGLAEWGRGYDAVKGAAYSVLGIIRIWIDEVAIPETNQIHLELRVTYYSWGMDKLRVEINKAVWTEAHRQHRKQKRKGRGPQTDKLKRRVRLYLWRKQGLMPRLIAEKWNKENHDDIDANLVCKDIARAKKMLTQP